MDDDPVEDKEMQIRIYVRNAAQIMWGYPLLKAELDVRISDKYMYWTDDTTMEWDIDYQGLMDGNPEVRTPMFYMGDWMEEAQRALLNFDTRQEYMEKIERKGGWDDFRVFLGDHTYGRKEEVTLIPGMVDAERERLMETLEWQMSEVDEDVIMARMRSSLDFDPPAELPMGTTLGEIEKIVREYVPVLRARIENSIEEQAKWYFKEYRLVNEIYLNPQLVDTTYFGVNVIVSKRIAREQKRDNLVNLASRNRALATLAWIYKLHQKDQRLAAEEGRDPLIGIGSLPFELVTGTRGFQGVISSFVTKSWPTGYQLLLLADLFEERMEDELGGRMYENTVVLPEELRSLIAIRLDVVESIAAQVLHAPLDRREWFLRHHANVLLIGQHQLKGTLGNFVSVSEMRLSFIEDFIKDMKKRAEKFPQRLQEFQTKKGYPISATRFRMESRHVILESFTDKEIEKFLREMIKRNIASLMAAMEELKAKKEAMSRAVEEQIPLKTPSGRPRKRLKSRFLLDYSKSKPSTRALEEIARKEHWTRKPRVGTM